MSGDVLTLQQCVDAVEYLRKANVPTNDDGYYVLHVHPDTYEDIRLENLLEGRSYRVGSTAIRILWHERTRQRMGKRGRPTARECFDRALRLEEQAASREA